MSEQQNVEKVTPDLGLTWAERTRLNLSKTPEGRAALAEAEERQKYLVEQPCSAGNCVELIDSRTGENTGGWGPVGCPCQDDESSSSTPAPIAKES